MNRHGKTDNSKTILNGNKTRPKGRTAETTGIWRVLTYIIVKH